MERKFISTLSRLIGGGGTAAQAQAAGTNGPAAARAERPNKAYLSAMRIFRDLSADEIKVVERSTVMTTAPKGKIVYQPEETGETVSDQDGLSSSLPRLFRRPKVHCANDWPNDFLWRDGHRGP